MSKSAFNRQVDGTHYQKYEIDPFYFFAKNGIPFDAGAVIKYVLRHQDKNKKADLEKAIHCIEMMIEAHYGDES